MVSDTGKSPSGVQGLRSLFRNAFLGVLITLTVTAAGCIYENVLTRVETPGGRFASPDPDRYGTLELTWVKEFHKPQGLFTFPDGGKPFETAYYARVIQARGSETVQIAQIHLEPVRRGDFGNPMQGEFKWAAADRFTYRVANGYHANPPGVRVVQGEIIVPPLY